MQLRLSYLHLLTMQDIFYRDNEKAGERRRVWASCQVDGYTDMAGGISFRKTQGDRFRFKVMHKIYDYEKRFGYPMCVGCGRCDDVCPEYISYSNCINRLAKEKKPMKNEYIPQLSEIKKVIRHTDLEYTFRMVI